MKFALLAGVMVMLGVPEVVVAEGPALRIRTIAPLPPGKLQLAQASDQVNFRGYMRLSPVALQLAQASDRVKGSKKAKKSNEAFPGAIKKGLLIGLGVGAGLGVAVALSIRECDDLTIEELFTTECTTMGKLERSSRAGGILGAVGGLVGLGIGAIVHKSIDVGGRTFEPLVDVGRGGRTLMMSVRFRHW